MSSTQSPETVEEVIQKIADRHLQLLETRHPAMAAVLQGRYTVRVHNEDAPPTHWVCQDERPLQPFGTAPEAAEGRRACIYNDLVQFDSLHKAAQ